MGSRRGCERNFAAATIDGQSLLPSCLSRSTHWIVGGLAPRTLNASSLQPSGSMIGSRKLSGAPELTVERYLALSVDDIIALKEPTAWRSCGLSAPLLIAADHRSFHGIAGRLN